VKLAWFDTAEVDGFAGTGSFGPRARIRHGAASMAQRPNQRARLGNRVKSALKDAGDPQASSTLSPTSWCGS
jgi:hypothetical protein